jgi:hypothetical protein
LDHPAFSYMKIDLAGRASDWRRGHHARREPLDRKASSRTTCAVGGWHRRCREPLFLFYEVEAGNDHNSLNTSVFQGSLQNSFS